jgi:hypothetical protein
LTCCRIGPISPRSSLNKRKERLYVAALDLLPRASAALGTSPLNVAVAMSHLLGLALGATILRIDPLADASEDELVDLVVPAIQGYLRSGGKRSQPGRRSDDKSRS